MSTSSLPASTKRIPVRLPPIKPPILASDILRDEVAPRAPARKAIRLALLAFAATFLVGAVAATTGLGPVRLTAPWAFEGALGTALVALFAAFAPVPYGARAWIATLAGAAPLAMGAAHIGPLARLGDDGTTATAAMAVMGTALPGALVFRARYRAFRASRVILSVALIASVPAIALLGLAALAGSGSTGERLLAGIGVLSAAAATLGFMGPETSAGCAQWAALVIGAEVARPALRAVVAAWGGRDAEMVAMTAAALGELIATTLVTFALFQILAAALAGQARQVDVHRAVGAGASEPGPRLDSRFED
jgi:hypothetical protein